MISVPAGAWPSIWRQNKIKRSEGAAAFRSRHVSSQQKLRHELHLANSLLKDQTEKSRNNAPKPLLNQYLSHKKCSELSCTSELRVQLMEVADKNPTRMFCVALIC